ncbi:MULTISPECIES: integrase arm-type DNA-binding domain-containing protein [Acinetobacter]|uniref:tyrosine-type recombinase/integrase n=1 Tax=Acinetobacter TaxID=469 RepID=UPI00165F10C1|nr:MULTISPECIES: integrase arm-type DNA-binding domain-containing protein [Acinetobacter]EHU1450424.1 tyrosine-type recombinase/integrase [Acinetobacter baumannii]EHU1801807.1 tyrosine-type recombinase/integrase [Acinetobacter baumannii]MBD0189349.1 tyrosine-type recombinase/integrase [Acinetobacter baumannii]MCO9048605.1 tyrosine-type recombinase/integrase [Acinetobacter sp. UC24323]MDC4464852.1 tyrosine-type recombinase/integrase [Acinetobacter baumannii]
MLSDSKIRSAKPKEKLYRLGDSDGLCVEIKPNGKKYWRYRFQWLKKTQMMSLGEYPIVGLAEARTKRDEAKSLVASGINPIEEKENQKKAKHEEYDNRVLFKDVAAEFKKEKLNNRSERYQEAFQRALDKDILKVIGDKDIKEVTSADVLTIMKKTIARVKRQKNHGTGEVSAIQNRTFIGGVMRYAIATLRADYDPTYAVKNVVERPEIEHARPMEKHEAVQLRNKLNSYGGSTTVKNAGLVMLYSMLRTIEIRRMKWEYVDFEARTITFPKEMMKKKRIHIVPMSDQVFNILQEQRNIVGNREYVFPAIYQDGMLSATTLNKMLDYIGLSDVTAHDFRATASTLLNEKDYDDKWIEKQLAHADGNKTRATYNHAKYLESRRKMLQDWANIVDSWAD